MELFIGFIGGIVLLTLLYILAARELKKIVLSKCEMCSSKDYKEDLKIDMLDGSAYYKRKCNKCNYTWTI